MITKILISTLLGGIVLFVWGGISHELLPFYNHSLLKFTNEDAVAQTIVANAPASGVYFMPYVPQSAKGMSESEFRSARDKARTQMRNGPFLLGSIRLGAAKPIANYFIIQLMSDMLTALFLALILIKTAQSTYRGRLMLCIWASLATFAVKSLPMWNWYSFSTSFTIAELVDVVGRMFFAGLVLAKTTAQKM